MARDEQMDARLWRWAEWLKTGDGSGYPVKSVLHEDWSPPSKGALPTMRVAPPGSDARQTHDLVGALKPSWRATVAAHYVLRMTTAQAAVALSVQPDTVLDRLERIHAHLRRELGVFATSG